MYFILTLHISSLLNIREISHYLNDKQSYTYFLMEVWLIYGFPGGSVVKNLPANAGDTGLTPGSGRSPGKESDNLLQYSCLGNSMDRGDWWATVHGVAKSWT